MSDLIYTLNNISYRYFNGILGLNNVSADICEGEKIVVLGANGSGKTTFLKLLDGLIFPSSGSISAFGKELSENIFNNDNFNLFFRKKVAFLFQDSDVQLFSPTVADEIAYGPIQLELTTIEVEKRVEDILHMLHIEALKDRYTYELSYGEKKKVAIASILSSNPDVLLLDEPTAGLDPRSTREVIDFITASSQIGKTVVTATQDIHIVPEIADKVLVLNEEKELVTAGKAENILSDMDLLSSNNLIHIHKHLHDGIWHVHPHQHYKK
ncbi:MAG: energy-coupling factor ABC transporter ATP-binding protein [Fidelibacterota bacterium]